MQNKVHGVLLIMRLCVIFERKSRDKYCSCQYVERRTSTNQEILLFSECSLFCDDSYCSSLTRDSEFVLFE